MKVVNALDRLTRLFRRGYFINDVNPADDEHVFLQLDLAARTAD